MTSLPIFIANFYEILTIGFRGYVKSYQETSYASWLYFDRLVNNPFMLNGLFLHYQLEQSISFYGMLDGIFDCNSYFLEISVSKQLRP